MRKNRHWIALLTIAFLLLTLAAGCGTSQTKAPASTASSGSTPAPAEKKLDYPTKSIEFVVPFAAGGGSDIFARNIERVISSKKLIPQPLVIMNKEGASGSIGYAYVAQKKGDPYSLATVSSSFYTAPILGQSPVTYKNFTPIAGLAMDTLILTVKADSKFQSVQSIIDEAKAKPKTLNVGGTSGTSDDAVMYYAFGDRTKTDMKYVPFNSGAEVVTALLGGHIDLAWVNPGEALSQLDAKTLRALGVASPVKLSGLPNVPTLKEQGIDLALAQFRGVVAPQDIPADVVTYLQGVFEKVSQDPSWKDDYLKKNMIESRYLNAKDFAAAIVDTTKMYEEFLAKVKAANTKK